MNKEFIPYEQALELKELGFDEQCFGFYTLEGCYFPNTTELNSLSYACASPLYQQAFRWFREKHQLDTSINTVYSKYNDALSKKYSGVIDDKSVFTNIGFYDAYEEAELACLDKLIEIATKQ